MRTDTIHSTFLRDPTRQQISDRTCVEKYPADRPVTGQWTLQKADFGRQPISEQSGNRLRDQPVGHPAFGQKADMECARGPTPSRSLGRGLYAHPPRRLAPRH